MPKKIMQDIVVTKKERTVHLDEETRQSGERHNKESEHLHTYTKETPEPKHENTDELEVIERSPIFEQMRQKNEQRKSFSEEYIAEKDRGWKRYIVQICIGIFFVFVVGLWLYDYFAYSAIVKLTPLNTEIALVSKEFTAAENDTDAVPFQIMTVTKEESVDLVPTEEKMVNTKASGQITIYNNFSGDSQTLINKTRFQSPDGKIFRIDKQIIVPGIKTVGGKSMPGELTVTVYADISGPDYNIGPTEFTIPGFKDGPRYTKFSAKSTTAMKGGASGTSKVVSDADIERAQTQLLEILRTKLLSEAETKYPSGQVFFPEAVFYTFTNVVDEGTSASQVKFTIKGSLSAVLFDSDALYRKIVGTDLKISENDKIKITNIKDIKFAWKTSMSVAPKNTDVLNFLLTGSAKAVWVPDATAWKYELAGVSKDEGFKNVLSQFSGIKSATPIISPMWRGVFPTDTNKIQIDIVEEL